MFCNVGGKMGRLYFKDIALSIADRRRRVATAPVDWVRFRAMRTIQPGPQEQRRDGVTLGRVSGRAPTSPSVTTGRRFFALPLTEGVGV